jgi:tetratricopeptide (TPR) repeat protein
MVWHHRRMKCEPQVPQQVENTWFEPAAIPGGQKDLSQPGFARALVLLALLGLVIRLGFFVEHSHLPSFGVPTLDQKYYDTVARMILAGDDLRELHGFKPLLYPLFLAGCYWLGGAWGINLAILLQHLMGVATGVLVAWLGAKLFRNRLAGIIGGILFLLAPLPLSFEGELLVESSYTFLICAALLVHFTAAARQGKPAAWWWIAAGGMLALAAQERSNILVFAAVYPLLAIGRACFARGRENWLPLLGVAGMLAVMILFGAVNSKSSGEFQLIPGAGGVNLYLGNKRTATGMTAGQENRVMYAERYEDPIEIWSRQEYAAAMHAQGVTPDNSPSAVSSYWTRRAIEEIRADPRQWIQLLAKKTWLMTWNAEIPNNKAFAFEQQESLWLHWLPVRWVWLFALAPLGIWTALKFGSRERLFMLVVFLFSYAAGTILFFISDRYRYPLWPGMAVLAGGAVLALFRALMTFRIAELSRMFVSFGIMAAISLPNWYAVKLPTFARDYLFRSMAWYEKGNYAEALADVDRSLELDTADASAWQQRGNALVGLNRFAEACVAYQQALQSNPEEARTWNNLGTALDDLGKTQEALSAFQRATECQPPSRNAFLGIAFIRFRAGQLDETTSALKQFEQLGRTPDAVSLTLHSLIERQRGNVATADDLEKQARSLDTDATQWTIAQATRVSVQK